MICLSLFAQTPEQQNREWKHGPLKHSHANATDRTLSDTQNVSLICTHTQSHYTVQLFTCHISSSQRWGSVIGAPVAVEQRVRRLLEDTGASARPGGPAGRASWVSVLFRVLWSRQRVVLAMIQCRLLAAMIIVMSFYGLRSVAVTRWSNESVHLCRVHFFVHFKTFWFMSGSKLWLKKTVTPHGPLSSCLGAFSGTS